MNKEYENISFFLDGCTKYGLNKSDLFQVIRKILDQRKNAPVSPVKHVKIIRWPFSLSRDSQTNTYRNSLFIASQAFYVGIFKSDLLDRGLVRRLQRSASPNDDFQARWNGEKEGLCRASDWRQNCKQERTKFHWRAAQRRTEHHRTTGKHDRILPAKQLKTIIGSNLAIYAIWDYMIQMAPKLNFIANLTE